MSRYAMHMAIQRRDNVLLMICMNTCFWFLRSNVVLENVAPAHFFFALGAANVLLVALYLQRYCKLSAAFAASFSNPARAALYNNSNDASAYSATSDSTGGNIWKISIDFSTAPLPAKRMRAKA